MGKGDRRTKRGKIWRGSYGRTRPHRKHGVKGPRTAAARAKAASAPPPPAAPADAEAEEQSPGP